MGPKRPMKLISFFWTIAICLRISHFKGYKIGFSVKKYQHKNQGRFREITVASKSPKIFILVQKLKKTFFFFNLVN